MTDLQQPFDLGVDQLHGRVADGAAVPDQLRVGLRDRPQAHLLAHAELLHHPGRQLGGPLQVHRQGRTSNRHSGEDVRSLTELPQIKNETCKWVGLEFKVSSLII